MIAHCWGGAEELKVHRDLCTGAAEASRGFSLALCMQHLEIAPRAASKTHRTYKSTASFEIKQGGLHGLDMHDAMCPHYTPTCPGKTNLSYNGLNSYHVPYWSVNNPTHGEFYFTMIGTVNIEASESNISMNALLPQTSYPSVGFRLFVPVLSWLFNARGRPLKEPFPVCPQVGTRQPALAAGAARAIHQQPMGSRLGPSCTALRVNPLPEVTDPFYRLSLPTLFHRLEFVHLGDLMRLRVRPGVDGIWSFIFLRAVGRASDTMQRVVLFQPLDPTSG
ncbi:hypothetical protein FXO37_27190 [Capsicum annuum]|nr:hypothetical protein FXO37_27190 [Capsicum annuum]